MAEQEQHIATEQARAGSMPHNVHYIPGISLTLALIVMIVILWGY